MISFTLVKEYEIEFYIYKTKKSMLRSIRRNSKVESDTIGLTIEGPTNSVVLLCEDHLGAGIVSHECLHAVFNMHKALNMKIEEESLATELQYLVSKFWEAYYDIVQ